MLGVKPKKPADRLDYDIDFGPFLDEGDTLTDATATAEDGLTIESVQVFDQIAKVWIVGGEAGQSYRVFLTATTAAGRVKALCFVIRVTGC